MPILGNPKSYHHKFKFVVEVDLFGSAAFQKCSELSVEAANVQYFEGGSLIPAGVARTAKTIPARSISQ